MEYRVLIINLKAIWQHSKPTKSEKKQDSQNFVNHILTLHKIDGYRKMYSEIQVKPQKF